MKTRIIKSAAYFRETFFVVFFKSRSRFILKTMWKCPYIWELPLKTYKQPA